MEFFSIENILGGVALFFTLLTFFFDKKKTILLLQMSSLIFYSGHLFLLGFMSAALLLFVQIFRNLFFSLGLKRWMETGIMLGLLVFFIIINLKHGEDLFSWLATIGSMVGTFALWLRNTSYLRFVFLFSAVPWFIYVSHIGHAFPILMQLFYVYSLVINIYRFDLSPRLKQAQ